MTTKKTFLTGVFAAAALIATACADADIADVGVRNDAGIKDAGGPPALTPVAPNEDAAVVQRRCVATECPAPFATCLSPSGPVYKCGTDLSSDSNNCGECGNACPQYRELNVASRCIDGRCELQCVAQALPYTQWQDCNNLIDDGCESDAVVDPDNCGACGNACPEGTACLEGRCGCEPGLTYCAGACVNLQSDDTNCGECGNSCDPPDVGCAAGEPTNTYYGCRAAKCEQLKCESPAADCNGDVAALACGSDGCEVADLTKDRNNCGGCGIECAAGEECVNEGNGIECAVPCSRFGRTKCGDFCIDLLNDVAHCGSCGNTCRQPGANETRACSKGFCEFECADGFADCNADPSDGCETNTRVHPANCGSCGNRCNLDRGQPCIEGVCLTEVCAPGVVQ